jgi:hypothetical protein
MGEQTIVSGQAAGTAQTRDAAQRPWRLYTTDGARRERGSQECGRRSIFHTGATETHQKG